MALSLSWPAAESPAKTKPVVSGSACAYTLAMFRTPMFPRRSLLILSTLLLLALVTGGCVTGPEVESATAEPTATTEAPTVATIEPTDQAVPTVPSVPTAPAVPTATRFIVTVPIAATPRILAPGDPVPAEIIAAAETAWGAGGIYVASLPRPNDVPAGWQLARSPRFEERSPGPGDTYRFACEDLPARSTGVASVAYRFLEGLPSVSVEYVVYPTAEHARDALNDMRNAAEACDSFTVGSNEVSEEVAAAMNPLPFAETGDGSFAVTLETSSETAGDLTTHVIKILRDNVVIGINHAVSTGQPLPDAAVSNEVARLAVLYLDQIDQSTR